MKLIASEREIQKTILDYLALKGINAWRTNSGIQFSTYKDRSYITRLAPKGTPDIIGFLNDGRFLGIEVKKLDGKVSDEQNIFINKINKAGGLAFVAYSLDDVIETFKKLKCG